MRITKALEAEKEDIFNLIKDNAKWISSMEIIQWPLDWLDTQKTSIYQSIDNGNFYTYYISGELAAVVELLTEPEALWGFDQEKSIYIHKLAVSMTHKGSGLGRSIMEEIIEWAKNKSFAYVRLDCVADNSKLRAYYESLGFTYLRTERTDVIDLALFELPLAINALSH